MSLEPETVHSNKRWNEKDDFWVCPVCARSKRHIIRLSKAGTLIGQIHEHHDHMADRTNALLKEKYGTSWPEKLRAAGIKNFGSWQNNFDALLTRFRPIEMCMDCNDADGRAKRAIDANRWFTFSPTEMRTFVKATSNLLPYVDAQVANELYQRQSIALQRRLKVAQLGVSALLQGKVW